MIPARVLLSACLFAEGVFAQNVIGTLAGTDPLFPAGQQFAVSAPLGHVQDVARDTQQNLYISDRDNHVVVKVASDGTLIVFAGNGLNAFSGDGGAAVNASLRGPQGLAVDRSAAVFVSDQFDHRIRRIATDGTISTFAGTGIAGFTGDGPAAANRLNEPRGLAFDSAGNLYVADSVNNRVRRITPQGIMSTAAGTGGTGNSGDGGLAIQAGLNSPTSVALDGAGNLFIATADSVRKVSPAGTISTLKVSTQFGLIVPSGISFDQQNNLYVSDAFSSHVLRVAPDGTTTTIAGNGLAAFSGDGGPAIKASLSSPAGLTVSSSGVVFVADRDNFRVRRIDTDSTIRTTAGNGRFHFSGDGQPASSATFSLPVSVAVDSQGGVLIADLLNNRVRKVTPDSIVNTVAGTDTFGFAGDNGPATAAALASPQSVAVDASGFYIADRANNLVRKVDLQGVIRTFAGGLRFPYALAADGAGNLYIADTNNDRIRKVTADGNITTVAGGGNSSAEGIAATSARLNAPQGVALDAQGRIYISDTDNNRIRMVNENGRIATIAGGGASATEGAPATSAFIDSPRGLALDAAGNLYFSEFNANRVRRITGGVIATVAGVAGSGGFGGDGGPATSALLNGPLGLAIDAAGNLDIADSNNNRVRTVFASPPKVQVTPTTINFAGIAGGLRTAPRLVSIFSPQLSGLPFTATQVNKSPWLNVFPSAGQTPVQLEISADPSALTPGNYSETIRISTPSGVPPSTDVAVQFSVKDAGQPQRSVEPETLSFAFVLNSPAKSQPLIVANLGGGSLAFTARADNAGSVKWLSVNPGSGTATSASPSSLTVTATPGALPEGTYTGVVTVTAGGDVTQVPVTMTITRVPQTIRLSQSGLTLTGVAGGVSLPPQSFSVLNAGSGIMNWTASVVARPGARIVLSVSPASGASDASSRNIPSVKVTANLMDLAPGEYFNQIKVESPTALNSPQFLPVIVEVLRPDQDPGPAIQPSELVFTSIAGAPPPSSQDLLIYNLKGSALAYRSQKITANGKNWLQYLLTEATVDSQQPRRMVVQPDTTLLLTPQVEQAVLTVNFDSGITRKINVLAVILPVPPGSVAPHSLRAAQAACTPKDLVPTLTVLGQGFTVPAGFPSALEVHVVDDCGLPVNDGPVQVSFSNGDLPLSLISSGDGRWTGTWIPSLTQDAIKLTVTAQATALGFRKTLDVGGNVRSTQATPLVNHGGVVSAASLDLGRPLSPGGMVSIFGSNLANGTAQNPPLPLPTTLAGASVVVAGQELPLTYAGPGQLNAILPYDLKPNSDYQLIVSTGTRVSNAERIVIASAQPAIFITGAGPAIVDTKGNIITQQNPAHPGDVVLIFAAGLGALSGNVIPGVAPGPVTTVEEPIVQIGNSQAKVLYSGLAPDFPALYQLNVEIPSDVPAGNANVVITISGQSSPAVQIPIVR